MRDRGMRRGPPTLAQRDAQETERRAPAPRATPESSPRVVQLSCFLDSSVGLNFFILVRPCLLSGGAQRPLQEKKKGPALAQAATSCATELGTCASP